MDRLGSGQEVGIEHKSHTDEDQPTSQGAVLSDTYFNHNNGQTERVYECCLGDCKVRAVYYEGGRIVNPKK